MTFEQYVAWMAAEEAEDAREAVRRAAEPDPEAHRDIDAEVNERARALSRAGYIGGRGYARRMDH